MKGGLGNGLAKRAGHKQETPLLGVAFRCPCAGHWPPRQVENGEYLLRSDYGLPGWLSLLRAAHWRLLMPGARCCSGRPGVKSQLPIHHWRFEYSNRRSVGNSSWFQSLARNRLRDFFDFWELREEISSKNHSKVIFFFRRPRFNAGNSGNNEFPGQPAQCAGSALCIAGKARRCADRRSAKVGKTLARRWRLRSLRPMSRQGGSRG